MRVISGLARGRLLRATGSTRPTADLIKGAMFSMLEAAAYKLGVEPDDEGRLAAALTWPRVLDLFAGSGGLGIEALSRGAEWADFVEQDREAARVLESNLRSAEVEDRAHVHQTSVEAALRRIQEPVDLVFLDPPYADAAVLERALQALAASGLLKPSGVVLIEQPATSEPPPSIGLLPLDRSRRHGRTLISLYRDDNPLS